MRWRFWLIDGPAFLTEVASAWYRLYFTGLVILAAVVPLGTLMAALVLWFGFGVRWGW